MAALCLTMGSPMASGSSFSEHDTKERGLVQGAGRSGTGALAWSGKVSIRFSGRHFQSERLAGGVRIEDFPVSGRQSGKRMEQAVPEEGGQRVRHERNRSAFGGVRDGGGHTRWLLLQGAVG